MQANPETLIAQFTIALQQNAEKFDVELTTPEIERLQSYYALILKWNERLHLVGPCSPEEFATRHVLESLLLLRHLPAALLGVPRGLHERILRGLVELVEHLQRAIALLDGAVVLFRADAEDSEKVRVYAQLMSLHIERMDQILCGKLPPRASV